MLWFTFGEILRTLLPPLRHLFSRVDSFSLQTFPEGYFNSYRDEKTRKTNVLTLMKKAIKLREEWESLRILLDVVRQREKRKLALLKLQQEVF